MSFSGTGFLCLGRALHQHLQTNVIILFPVTYTLHREFGYTDLSVVLFCQPDFPVYSYLNCQLWQLCLSLGWVKPLAQRDSSLGLVLLDAAVMQINDCWRNPGLVPPDTSVILGVLVCLITLSVSLRLGSVPCCGGNVHTVEAVMPNHSPKNFPSGW